MINTRFLYYKTQESFEADKQNILNDSIVFVGEPPIIWTHGTYYTGGGSPGPTPPTPTYTIDITATPIKYLLSKDRTIQDPQFNSRFTTLNASSATATSGTRGLSINGNFLYMAVPNNITLTRAVTSNQEVLDINTNFVVDRETVEGHVLYKYLPVIAPSNLSITFTFRVS